jgi:CheY-like chemotaxis protein
LIAGRKLLLADDSVAIQKVIDLTFTDEGMEVTTVGDGRDALEKLDEFTPDVVLADIFMPGVDGYELCKFIKENERFRGVPVMLLVGSFEPFDEGEAKRAGADDVVTKPFQSIRDLVSRVGSLVGHDEESANSHSVLGLNQTEAKQEVKATEEATAGVRVEVEEPEQPSVKVFVEAPIMETIEAPVAQEHTCPPDIELQTADTQQLERITDEPMDQEPIDQEMDTRELQPVDDNQASVTNEEAVAPQMQSSEVEAAGFEDEGVLDLGDIDAYAPATVEDDFELDLDVAPVASFTESAVLDNEPAVESIPVESAQVASPSVNYQPDEVPSEAAPASQMEVAAANQTGPANLSPEAIEAISRRVVEQLSEKVVREIAWEVVPELSELLIKKRLEEQK